MGKEVRPDYLKYYKAVKRYALTKYNLTGYELDFLLLIYNETYFYTEVVRAFDKTTPWNTAFVRGLLDKGYIIIFKMEVPFRSKRIYKISHKGMFICKAIYDILDGKEMPTATNKNKMFKASAKWKDRKFRDLIMRMNAQIYEKKLGENTELDLMPDIN